MEVKEQAKHTPGPLYADVRTGVAVISRKPTPNCLDVECDGEILRVWGNETDPRCSYKVISDEQAANIRLWAASPELASLLMESRENIGGNWRDRRDEVLRKAGLL